ncbi:hypothetical protein [Hymenobacter sp. BT491]|uniref:hypothetical protein n=1 Tax=Hymenobacter sp. BT491 TaxID=2766779 RepID=UPI0016537F5A|nr:hypothetical protein [Hymenobacter sp. BT491]MBC6988985.1 hypothetical protein [Hymenobacter sp. BT491]
MTSPETTRYLALLDAFDAVLHAPDHSSALQAVGKLREQAFQADIAATQERRAARALSLTDDQAARYHVIAEAWFESPEPVTT